MVKSSSSRGFDATCGGEKKRLNSTGAEAILIDYLSFHAKMPMLRGTPEVEPSTSFKSNMHKVNPLVRLALGFIALVSTSAQAQTYVYTYTGNDFTSASGPYTTSDKVTGSIAFSAPLGDNYNGNPSATMLNFNFSDGVGPQNIVGGPGVPVLGGVLVQDSIFGTDSSGAIVSWNFQVLDFLPSFTPETKGIQTENDPGNVVDSGNLDEASGIVGEGSVPSNPGVWVETVVPEPSVGPLFVSFAALVLAYGRCKFIAASSTLGK